MRLADDLARWEDGELSLHDVHMRHGREEVQSLLALRDRLSRPVVVPEPDWESLEARLGPQEAPVSRARRGLYLVTAAAAVLLAAVLSYGAWPEPLRDGLASVVDRITDVFTDDSEPVGTPLPTLAPTPSASATATPVVTPAPTPAPQPVVTAAPQPTDDSSGRGRGRGRGRSGSG